MSTDGTDAADNAAPFEPEADAAPLDAAESLRIIAAQADRVRSTQVDGRVLFGLWGVAWLLGYLGLYLTANGSLPGGRATPEGVLTPAPLAFTVFALLIAGAMAATIVYSIRAGAGVQGVSSRTGAMYGWSWCIGFVGMSVILGGLVNAGASDEVIILAANALACLVVGIMYMAGGALWQDTRQYILGIWIIAVAAIALYVGLPNTYLVMAVLGGGGFFLGALGDHLVRVRDRATAQGHVGSQSASKAHP
ncbi:hypothetical protein SAMN05216410_0805 [Sanguibacter gelidistatuariae]|uniref:Uncharacterized protein n=1 Tax=Sanguibacter gelidistatuariae TaxID=1814289 RepID=A0A1G6H866_9MICO|nr:hypothetical protein [Sanguibacter gelidistatuariae]SDB90135.1 hypothetical protein SAMN05216410_0805 [Sanguibacter gelidistatuariae]